MNVQLMARPIAVTAEVSRRFANMSFLCAVLVVLLHCSIAVRTDIPYLIFRGLSCDGLCRIAIPWFSFAAGFFFVSHFSEPDWYCQAMLKRIRTLLVPYWLWFILGMIVVPIVIRALQNQQIGCGWLKDPDLFLQLVGLHLSSSCGMLWYLRTLFLILLLVPLVVKAGWVGWFVCCIGYVVFQIWSYPSHGAERFFEYCFSLRVSAYVFAGVFARLGLLRCPPPYGGVAILGLMSICAKMIFLRYKLYYWAGVCDVAMVPGLMVLMYEICGKFSLPRLLTSLSFPIYMVHVVVLRMIRMYYHEIHGVRAIGCFIIALAASIGISLLICLFMPKTESLLFGNRFGLGKIRGCAK